MAAVAGRVQIVDGLAALLALDLLEQARLVKSKVAASLRVFDEKVVSVADEELPAADAHSMNQDVVLEGSQQVPVQSGRADSARAELLLDGAQITSRLISVRQKLIVCLEQLVDEVLHDTQLVLHFLDARVDRGREIALELRRAAHLLRKLVLDTIKLTVELSDVVLVVAAALRAHAER